ncbi:DUF3617 domain-containing protein [Erythrobacter dokdonensis]|uniref:DUF3617 domain-containing protein n=1 Tax=Erythrobacter dokdonensis DSW-74 TaxID=1300349 RepID=A0A1A7BHP0_9SPHN|nr:DUF3617 domain-containing protein [Erythrobacter dokdonensis]OBV11999.1 DUF3617 domain-containing protein [Erythrobacter dokdonensis DSW-74]
MKRMAMIGLMGALVAGCSGGADSGGADADGDGTVSAEEIATKVEAEGIKPEPGQYKATITMTAMEIPGMPADMAGHGTGMTTTTEYCLTQEDVQDGFEEMMKRGQNGDCSYESFNLDDGNFDAVMVCRTPEGDARMSMEGTATPTTSDFTATMAMNVPEMGEGKMTFAAKHERIGDCPAQ